MGAAQQQQDLFARAPTPIEVRENPRVRRLSVRVYPGGDVRVDILTDQSQLALTTPTDLTAAHRSLVFPAVESAARFVAVRVTKRLQETERFTRHLVDSRRENAQNPHCHAPKTHGGSGRSVQGVILIVAFLGNVFLATASIFQNRYLKDVRGYSAVLVATFSLLTTLPSAMGLVFGGRLADDYGRRVVASTCIPVGSLMIALSFVARGPLMWIVAIDRKSTRLNSSHVALSRMPSSA